MPPFARKIRHDYLYINKIFQKNKIIILYKKYTAPISVLYL